MNKNSAVKAVVHKTFAVPAETVFDAWLIAPQLGNWMFGPKVRDEETVSLNNEVRVGGRFSFVVRREGKEIDHVGEYLEIRRPERLAFTWGIEGESGDSQVIVELREEEGKTRLKLTHKLDSAWADYVQPTKTAWAHMLDLLGDFLTEAKSQRALPL
ncbi:MAG: SRPBCC family protein [Pseudohongiellaceae bacterium]